MLEILNEGMPTSSGGFAGLFRDELSQKLMQMDTEEEEKTERVIDYADDLESYDIESQVMRSPVSRTRSIPRDAPNPHVPGETYSDTTKRVERIADELQAKSEESSRAAAEKRRQANLAFKKSHSGEGTGVLPYGDSDFESTEDLDLDSLLAQIKNIEFTSSEPPEGDTTKVLNRKDLEDRPSIQESLSHGALIRKRYYGRY